MHPIMFHNEFHIILSEGDVKSLPVGGVWKLFLGVRSASKSFVLKMGNTDGEDIQLDYHLVWDRVIVG